jgi:hypothetical protein
VGIDFEILWRFQSHFTSPTRNFRPWTEALKARPYRTEVEKNLQCCSRKRSSHCFQTTNVNTFWSSRTAYPIPPPSFYLLLRIRIWTKVLYQTLLNKRPDRRPDLGLYLAFKLILRQSSQKRYIYTNNADPTESKPYFSKWSAINNLLEMCLQPIRSQSYDFWIYSYNASVEVG